MEFRKTYTLNKSAPKKPRHFFVLLDGTWNDETGNDGDDVVTNIVKLYRMLGPDSDSQITRYFRGVGNDEDNGWFEQFTEGAFGAGEKKIRDHAYATICKEYQPGDQLFILGFSRGAASARMLASDLHKKGLPDQITIEQETYANKATRNLEYRFRKYTTKGNTDPIDNIFLGVWDTVYAFGIPVKLFGIPFGKYNLFKDKHVSMNVKKAVHCVAIDETRDPFEPVLMNYNPAVVTEVWFSGVHSDVGGGYSQDKLGDISLEFMLGQMRAFCQQESLHAIHFREDLISERFQQQKPIVFHFHGLGFKKSVRKITVLKNDQPAADLHPVLHPSVMDIHGDPFAMSEQTKTSLFKADRIRTNRILYNPPNIKKLMRKWSLFKA